MVLRTSVRIAMAGLVAVVFAGALAGPTYAQMEIIDNGGFETADLTGWTLVDHPEPYEPAGVAPGGVTSPFGLFTTEPSGDYAFVHPFDGGGAGTIDLYQDLDLPGDVGSVLSFGLRVGWDLERWCIGCEGRSRDFDVVIEPAGGGDPLYVGPVLRAEGGTALPDSGPQVVTVDLSAFAGQSVRLSLEATVPDDFTGPARLQIDSVALEAVPLETDQVDEATAPPSLTPGIPAPAAGVPVAAPAQAAAASPRFTG